MPEMLLELGCEELPATFVRKAYNDLFQDIRDRLIEAGMLPAESIEGVGIGTPRRLIVSFPNVSARQEDKTVEQRGPALQAAYDESGNPTKALLGFCKGQGVDPAELRKDDKYVWATKHVKGRDANDLLSELLPQAIKALNFEKSMRWGGSRMRFARPIRWILAVYDGKQITFDIEGVKTGTESVGHRFYAPEKFQATSLDQLLKGLEKRFVQPHPKKREEAIVSGAKEVASGDPEIPEALLDENVFLTEWPSALEGQFKEEFMELPREVLVTAMAKHEKFFPVKNKEGNITNRFVSIRNAGEDETVRKGNEWVLNARFNDAKFFFDEDSKHSLDEFLEKTSGILFQDRLGTVRQRADRLADVAAEIARLTHAPENEIDAARKAGQYCKADLSTGLVSELASLQGVIGGEYARRDGLAEEVCHAIATHYDLAKNPKIDSIGARTAVRTLLADQIDKLAGYLGLGLEPSGSSDPYGLRKAATLCIEAAWSWPGFPSCSELIRAGFKAYMAQGIVLDEQKAIEALAHLYASRYEALLTEVRHDILDASALADDPRAVLDPRAVKLRIECVTQLAEDNTFVHTATRPANIVSAAEKKGIAIGDPNKLDSAEGDALHAQLKRTRQALKDASANDDAKTIVDTLRTLASPINAFFDNTMIMVDDEAVRSSRLGLLKVANDQLRIAGDFTKVVIEG